MNKFIIKSKDISQITPISCREGFLLFNGYYGTKVVILIQVPEDVSLASIQKLFDNVPKLANLNHPNILQCLGYVDDVRRGVVYPTSKNSMKNYLQISKPEWDVRTKFIKEYIARFKYLRDRNYIIRLRNPKMPVDNLVVGVSPSSLEDKLMISVYPQPMNLMEKNDMFSDITSPPTTDIDDIGETGWKLLTMPLCNKDNGIEEIDVPLGTILILGRGNSPKP